MCPKCTKPNARFRKVALVYRCCQLLSFIYHPSDSLDRYMCIYIYIYIYIFRQIFSYLFHSLIYDLCVPQFTVEVLDSFESPRVRLDGLPPCLVPPCLLAYVCCKAGQGSYGLLQLCLLPCLPLSPFRVKISVPVCCKAGQVRTSSCRSVCPCVPLSPVNVSP